jgi:hypothetical protein
VADIQEEKHRGDKNENSTGKHHSGIETVLAGL